MQKFFCIFFINKNRQSDPLYQSSGCLSVSIYPPIPAVQYVFSSGAAVFPSRNPSIPLQISFPGNLGILSKPAWRSASVGT